MYYCGSKDPLARGENALAGRHAYSYVIFHARGTVAAACSHGETETWLTVSGAVPGNLKIAHTGTVEVRTAIHPAECGPGGAGRAACQERSSYRRNLSRTLVTGDYGCYPFWQLPREYIVLRIASTTRYTRTAVRPPASGTPPSLPRGPLIPAGTSSFESENPGEDSHRCGLCFSLARNPFETVYKGPSE